MEEVDTSIKAVKEAIGTDGFEGAVDGYIAAKYNDFKGVEGDDLIKRFREGVDGMLSVAKDISEQQAVNTGEQRTLIKNLDYLLQQWEDMVGAGTLSCCSNYALIEAKALRLGMSENLWELTLPMKNSVEVVDSSHLGVAKEGSLLGKEGGNGSGHTL